MSDAKVDPLGFEQNTSNEDVDDVEYVSSDLFELDMFDFHITIIIRITKINDTI